jgi:hypothetical protein
MAVHSYTYSASACVRSRGPTVYSSRKECPITSPDLHSKGTVLRWNARLRGACSGRRLETSLIVHMSPDPFNANLVRQAAGMNCFRIFASMHTRVDVVARAHRLLDWRNELFQKLLMRSKIEDKVKAQIINEHGKVQLRFVIVIADLRSLPCHHTNPYEGSIDSPYIRRYNSCDSPCGLVAAGQFRALDKSRTHQSDHVGNKEVAVIWKEVAALAYVRLVTCENVRQLRNTFEEQYRLDAIESQALKMKLLMDLHLYSNLS